MHNKLVSRSVGLTYLQLIHVTTSSIKILNTLVEYERLGAPVQMPQLEPQIFPHLYNRRNRLRQPFDAQR